VISVGQILGHTVFWEFLRAKILKSQRYRQFMWPLNRRLTFEKILQGRSVPRLVTCQVEIFVYAKVCVCMWVWVSECKHACKMQYAICNMQYTNIQYLRNMRYWSAFKCRAFLHCILQDSFVKRALQYKGPYTWTPPHMRFFARVTFPQNDRWQTTAEDRNVFLFF
jgi:hypothetical protein